MLREILVLIARSARSLILTQIPPPILIVDLRAEKKLAAAVKEMADSITQSSITRERGFHADHPAMTAQEQYDSSVELLKTMRRELKEMDAEMEAEEITNDPQADPTQP